MEMTIKEYLDKKEKEISKKKFNKLAKVLEGRRLDEKVKYLYFPGKSEEAKEESKPTTIDVITTIDKDRAEEVLIPSGCDLSGYSKTPTVLFGHNYWSIPVGVSKWQKIVDNGIQSKTEYFSSEFARDVFEASKAGALANSVGFIPMGIAEKGSDEYDVAVKQYGIEGNPDRVYTKWQLLEYSKVPVPCNPEAVTLAMKSVKSETMKEYLQNELEAMKSQETDDTIPEEEKEAKNDSIDDETSIDGAPDDTEPAKEEEKEVDLAGIVDKIEQILLIVQELKERLGGVEEEAGEESKPEGEPDPKPMEEIEEGGKELYACECIECGYTIESEEHCKNVKCEKCGGQVRRAERPGPGENAVSELAMKLLEEIKAKEGMKEKEQREKEAIEKMKKYTEELIRQKMGKLLGKV